MPRLTNTGRKRVLGRPRIDWAQTLIEIFCSFAQCSRSRMLEIDSDKSKYQFIVERPCTKSRHTARQIHRFFFVSLFSLQNDYMVFRVRAYVCEKSLPSETNSSANKTRPEASLLTLFSKYVRKKKRKKRERRRKIRPHKIRSSKSAASQLQSSKRT